MKPDKPNILLILTDQQRFDMMSCAGNTDLSTPALDRLAAAGVRFERVYCTNPVCVPSRFSLMTGRMPSEIGLCSDYKGDLHLPEELPKTGLGWLLRGAGYETAYGGKVHLPGMSAEDLGFDFLTGNERRGLAEVAAEFIRRKRSRPYFLVTSFINPHDICYMAIRDARPDSELIKKGKKELAVLDRALEPPEGVDCETFFSDYCPELPANFEPQEDEPEAIRDLLWKRPFRMKARKEYSEERWRLHRWAYCRLTEMVDSHIGQLLDAVYTSSSGEETVIFFTSDHGDLDAAHRMEHKSALYEEACRVPLIVSSPGNLGTEGVVKNRLVSNGLDLLPTICDYAGAEPPRNLRGFSLRTPIKGEEPTHWRDYLPVESEIGSMIVTDRYKYILYTRGTKREQLHDLEQDPGEMMNFAGDPGYREVRIKLRELFQKEWPERV